MQFSIRNAKRSDADAKFRINGEAFPGVSPLTPGYSKLLLTRRALFSVVEVWKEVAGYVYALDRNAEHDGEEFPWFRQNLGADFLCIDEVAPGSNCRRRIPSFVPGASRCRQTTRHDTLGMAPQA